MKAIIELGQSAVRMAAQQITEARQGHAADFRLSFESARLLFAELTPARLDLMDTLHGIGACSVYALAKAASRNYSNVHSDVSRLATLGLIEQGDDGKISVPFGSIEIRFMLAQAA